MAHFFGEEWRLKLRDRRELNEDDDDIVGSSAGVAVARRGFSVVAVVWLVEMNVQRVLVPWRWP